jgi:C-terminal processing protease CtpA/Prc
VVTAYKYARIRSGTVMVGDVIIKVSDVDLRGRKKHEVLAMLKGRAGTAVKLTVKRGNHIFDVRNRLTVSRCVE